MKNLKFVTLILLLFSVQSAFSQLNFGIKLGGNYNVNAYTTDSIDVSIENATTFSGGAFARIKMKKISVQAEGLLVHRNGDYVEDGINSKINFLALDVPLMLGYRLLDLKVVKLRVNGGVIASFPIGTLGDLEKANYKSSFYSATGGLSLDIPLFVFDLRYQGAIGDYYEFQNINSSTRLQNSLVTLSVGWKII